MQDNRFDIKNNAQVIKAMINKAMRKTAPQAASVTSPRNYYGDGYPPSGGSGFVNPMTTIGDIIYASETDTPADAVRLGIGTEGHVLTVASGVPVWAAGGGASNIEDGTVTGQMAYWDNVAGEWKHTEVTEMFWDDTAKGLGIGKDSATPTFATYLAVVDNTLNKTVSFSGIICEIIKTAGVSDINDEFYGISGGFTFNQAGGIIGNTAGLSTGIVITDGTVEGTQGAHGIRNTVVQGGGTIDNDLMGINTAVVQSGGTVSGDLYAIKSSVTIAGTVTGTSYVHHLASSNADYCLYQSGTSPNFLSALLTCNVGFIANEGGGDNDCRIEGDTNVNLLYTDAGNDRVGIGTASPAKLLHVAGVAKTDGEILIGGGITTAVSTKAASYTLTANDATVFLNYAFGGQVLTFPAAGSHAGRHYWISNINTGTWTLTTVSGQATIAYRANYHIVSDGIVWRIVGI